MSSVQTKAQPRRDGYVTLLAVSFALGLAVLGAAVAASARAYIRAATVHERGLLDRMAMESAVAEFLGQIAAGRPYRMTATNAPTTIGARTVLLEFSSPLGKADPGMDDAAAIRVALRSVDLGPPAEPGPLAEAGSLTTLSRRLGLDAAAEDCLRRVATYGRAPATRTDVSTPDAAADRTVRPGDQLDVRAAVAGRSEGRVLWTRVRFQGDASGRWLVHDYRPLSITKPSSCRSVD